MMACYSILGLSYGGYYALFSESYLTFWLRLGCTLGHDGLKASALDVVHPKVKVKVKVICPMLLIYRADNYQTCSTWYLYLYSSCTWVAVWSTCTCTCTWGLSTCWHMPCVHTKSTTILWVINCCPNWSFSNVTRQGDCKTINVREFSRENWWVTEHPLAFISKFVNIRVQ